MTMASDLGALWFVLYREREGASWEIWPKHGTTAQEADQIMNVEMPSCGLNPFAERKIVQVAFTLKDN